MIDFESKVNKLEVELASLREKINFYELFFKKVDSTLERVQELMEERRSDINHDVKDLYQHIADSERKVLDELQKLRDEMKKRDQEQNIKIDEINKWRWLVMGGAGVLGWIFAKVFGFK